MPWSQVPKVPHVMHGSSSTIRKSDKLEQGATDQVKSMPLLEPKLILRVYSGELCTHASLWPAVFSSNSAQVLAIPVHSILRCSFLVVSHTTIPAGDDSPCKTTRRFATHHIVHSFVALCLKDCQIDDHENGAFSRRRHTLNGATPSYGMAL